ncbi:unnamed protein product [Rotaria socialis]|uniref:FAD-binding FR-type domain-containing protein n=1 Tax=Rotaria socialis TaxID=392032 RepID=A0A820UMW5_9BILA|nr:unnamed protein product [Rotaria socialis]
MHNQRITSDTAIEMDQVLPSTMPNRCKIELLLQTSLNETEESWTTTSRQYIEQLDSPELSLEKIAELLKCKRFITQRLARIFFAYTNHDEVIENLNKCQIGKLMHVLNGTMEVRALVLFKAICNNNNHADYLTNAKLQEFFQQYFKDLKILDENRRHEAVQILLEKFHLDQKSRIDFEEYYSFVSNNPVFLKCLPQFTVNSSQIVIPRSNQSSEGTRKCRYNRLVLLARICGLLLNFNCSFIIALMLRQTIVFIRSHRLLRKLIPVDDHIDFHRVVGRFIAILSTLHTIAHIANFANTKEYSLATHIFTTTTNSGWIGGFAPLSGVVLLLILLAMVICSLKWIRSSGHFQIFYWSHLLYLPFYVFLILHARDFWKWIVGPLSIFLLEKLYSIYTRYTRGKGRTHIDSVTIDQSKAISLTIHRPKNFTFKPGDYISINLSRVAFYEFHPFTISSAPEETDFIRVHIADNGDWTKKVHQHFKGMSDEEAREHQIEIYRGNIDSQETYPNGPYSEYYRMHDTDNERTGKRESVIIKGPYSSCARYVFDSKHVVLIGAGIGVTPYASILSSLMAQFRGTHFVRRNNSHVYYISDGFNENRKLQKFDFIWLNRDFENFEWFLNLLRRFEQEQDNYLALHPNEKRFLDIHLYCTDPQLASNVDNAPLELVRKICAPVARRDIYTGLKSRTNFGRPSWEKIFNKFISLENASTADDVSVFFCGRSIIGEAIKRQCEEFQFRYYEEKF